MSPEKVLLVQQSFRWLLPGVNRTGTAFLARLGREAPEVARLLPATRADQRHLIAAFAFVIGTLDDLENLRPTLQASGARLRELGAGADAYDRFGDVLVSALAQALGPAWNPHLAVAWSEAWAMLAAAMQAEDAESLVAA